jgi:hypothetical protein
MVCHGDVDYYPWEVGTFRKKMMIDGDDSW